jgi:hypothetical protein
VDEITGDHQCGFQCNRSTNDHIFCLQYILGNKWEYNERVHKLFLETSRKPMIQSGGKYYTIFSQFRIPMKLLVMMIKMCLNEIYSKVHMGKHPSDRFHIQNCLKQGDALMPLL